MLSEFSNKKKIRTAIRDKDLESSKLEQKNRKKCEYAVQLQWQCGRTIKIRLLQPWIAKSGVRVLSCASVVHSK